LHCTDCKMPLQTLSGMFAENDRLRIRTLSAHNAAAPTNVEMQPVKRERERQGKRVREGWGKEVQPHTHVYIRNILRAPPTTINMLFLECKRFWYACTASMHSWCARDPELLPTSTNHTRTCRCNIIKWVQTWRLLVRANPICICQPSLHLACRLRPQCRLASQVCENVCRYVCIKGLGKLAKQVYV